MRNSQIMNLSVCNRRKLPWILLYFILAMLCWVLVHFLIQNEETNIRKDIQIPHNVPQELKIEIDVSSINSDANNYYIAAVIDYEVTILPTLRTAMMINLQFIVDAIAECSKNMVDIAVFPEGSLYKCIGVSVSRQTVLAMSTNVPSFEEKIVPCVHKDYETSYLRPLSCAAKQNKIYVAVNVVEKEHSYKSTASDRLLFYNTEVVFDRNGMVIARYRKFNLYQERWHFQMSSPDEPEFAKFTTDFGVEFGIIICFDIVFNTPALELVTKHNITHFIHSSQFLNKLPFLAASTIDSGWSYATDVVILSSSTPFPKYTTATNIYFGRRPGTRVYVKPFQQSNILIAPIPKKRHFITSEYPKEYKSLNEYIPSKIKPSWYLAEHIYDRLITKPLIFDNRNSATFRYKGANFECAIAASWELLGSVPNYQFIAYSGLNNYSVASINNYIEICGIALCSPFSSQSSCKQPPRFEDGSKLNFKSINISVRSTVLDPIRIPAATDINLATLDVAKFDFRNRIEDIDGEMVNHANMILKRSDGNLLSFGVYKYPTKATPITNFNHYDFMINLDVVT